jgi:uncharacterized protein YjbI with pentapeptide repeats
MVTILDIWDKVIFSSETANSLREAVVEAIGKGQSLDWAYLPDIDLSKLNLAGCDFSRAVLSSANFSDSDVSWGEVVFLCRAGRGKFYRHAHG